MKKSLMLKLFAPCAIASTIVPIVSCSCGGDSSKTVFYTITCNLNGGTFSGLTENTLKVVENSPIGSLPSPVKTNFIFDKWQNAEGVPLDPQEKITKNMEIYASYKHLSGSYISGGSTLLNFKKGDSGSDTNKWKLYNSGGTAVEGVTWTIKDKSTSAAISGLTIADGVVSWDNVAVGSYTAIVTAEKDEISASSEINVIVTNNAYTLTGGSSISTAYTGEAGEAEKAWTLSKDGSPVSSGVIWGVTGTTETSITVPDGKLTWTSATPAATYSLNITATVNSVQVASVPVNLVLNQTTFTVFSDISSLTINDNATATDTNEFKLLRNGTELTSDVTWSVASSTAPSGGTIEMDGNKIKYTNVAAGNYQLTITGKWIDATSTERSASKVVTLVSNSTKSQGVVISGKDTLLTTQSSEYTATVYPVSAATDLVWSVTSWTGTEATKPTFDSTTKNKLITNAGSEGKATIQVKDNNSNVTSTFDVQVNYPWTNSDKVWTTSSDSSSFISLSMNDLANSITQDDITAYDIDGIEISGGVTRSSLDAKTLYIGSEITNIPSNFLNGWTSFAGSISFVTSSKLVNIGEAFLVGCANFNSTLALPNSVNVIYNNFMDGCTSFNQTLSLPTSLTTIGDDFLYRCISFNQELALSSSIEYVGEAFMANCDAMVSTLTIDIAEPSLVFVVPSDVSYICTTETSTAACYATGITIAGGGATEFKQLFPNRTESPYRKLI